jgi:hypothetical protein
MKPPWMDGWMDGWMIWVFIKGNYLQPKIFHPRSLAFKGVLKCTKLNHKRVGEVVTLEGKSQTKV